VGTLYHYTDLAGYNAIRAQPVWVFKANQPPGGRPFGSYFTPLDPSEEDLAGQLGISSAKTEYVFCFTDTGDLKHLRGGRGKYVLYSPSDYRVAKSRQIAAGSREKVLEKLQ
jgi:hypothetical protein